jgi:hypothetical protein
VAGVAQDPASLRIGQEIVEKRSGQAILRPLSTARSLCARRSRTAGSPPPA